MKLHNNNNSGDDNNAWPCFCFFAVETTLKFFLDRIL